MNSGVERKGVVESAVCKSENLLGRGPLTLVKWSRWGGVDLINHDL